MSGMSGMRRHSPDGLFAALDQPDPLCDGIFTPAADAPLLARNASRLSRAVESSS